MIAMMMRVMIWYEHNGENVKQSYVDEAHGKIQEVDYTGEV